jgi:hypothetical protein
MTEQKIARFFRNATAGDIARVMAEETVEARFRDSEAKDWQIGRLNGWADGEFRCDLANCWKQCQVYDPPQCWLDKPDPGEGYRLLEKFPMEAKLGTDEVWRLFKKWETTANDNGVQEEDHWYRRRIEQKSDSCNREKLEAGKEYLLPNGLILIVYEQGAEVTK